MLNKKLLFFSLFIGMGYCKASGQEAAKLKSGNQEVQESKLLKAGKIALAAWMGSSILHHALRYYHFVDKDYDEEKFKAEKLGMYEIRYMTRREGFATFGQSKEYHRPIEVIASDDLDGRNWKDCTWFNVSFPVDKENFSFSSKKLALHLSIYSLLFYRTLKNLKLLNNSDINKGNSFSYLFNNFVNIFNLIGLPYYLMNGSILHEYDGIYHPDLYNSFEGKFYFLGGKAFALCNVYFSARDIYRSCMEYKKSLEQKAKKSIMS